MAKDRELKSAYELAMERLRREDRAAGREEHAPLTAAQKKKIASLRQKAKAKIAEIEILREQQRAEAGGDPEKLAEVEERFRTDKGRIESRLESDVARVRDGEP